MHRSRKLLCMILACCCVAHAAILPGYAAENPDSPAAEQETVSASVAPEEETVDPVLTEPAELDAQETLPTEEAAEAEAVHIMPQYHQTDYPDVYYGGNSMDKTGSSVTCLAMVATYLTGHEYLPDQLARYFAEGGNNNMERLEYGSKMLQLPFEKNWNWHVTLQALRDGKIAIVLLNGNSYFTQFQHFIVLTGLTEDGRILVRDPNPDNYDHWALKHGYEQGFTEGEIVCGFEGAWVYDPAAMPEEPFVFEEETVEAADYGPVPLYFQSDYPNTRYANGTVASSGCSITSLAMVATYLTGHEYLPDELARYFGGKEDNHMARLELGSKLMKLPYEKNTNWHTTLDALRDGKIAIALVNSDSDFTDSQHFIVLTGLTPDGRVVVNDSYESNYSRWELKDGFARGFATEAISCGFEGAWVYDKSTMPAEPFIYYVPELEHTDSRYEGVELTKAEEELLARVIWVEARGESPEGQQAVAEVALNRLVSDRFANNLRDVIYGENQFRSVPYLEDAEPGQAQYEAIEYALYGESVLPMDVFYFATKPTNRNVWGQIGNHIFCYAE